MMRFALDCSMRGVAAGSQGEPSQQRLASKEARVGELVLPDTQTGTRRQRQVAGSCSSSGAPVDAADRVSGAPPSYDELRIESAVIAYIANGSPAGSPLNALTLALPYGAQEIEDAVDRLQLQDLVHHCEGRLKLEAEPQTRRGR